jgi:hypothetical protein
MEVKANEALEALMEDLGLRAEGEPEPPVPQRRYISLCDIDWKKISASLRKDPDGTPSIYLKLPASKLGEIIHLIAMVIGPEVQNIVDTAASRGSIKYLQGLLDFLRQERAASSSPSIFLRIPVEEVERDLLSLKDVGGFGKNNPVGEFIAALEAGLRNDSTVDWIARCGGPADNVSNNADSTPQIEGVEILGLPE